jgi:hypothetical protein
MRRMIVMKIKLLHGRNAIDETMSSWGFDGPTITDVEFVHHSYGLSTVMVGFKSEAAAEAAARVTGWKPLCVAVLEMNFISDLLVCGLSFYGDYEIQED